MGLFEDLGWVDKSPERLRQEMEESNETNCRELFLKTKSEAETFKQENKEIIEYHTRKPINKVTLLDCVKLGFNSNNLTRKHLESLYD